MQNSTCQSATKQIEWLNCAKFIAILGVMLDHTYKVLYSNRNIANASYYSVSLFIIIAGMTSYLSDCRHPNESWGQTFWRSSKKLILAYCIAVFVYFVYRTHSFDLAGYLNCFIHFNIAGPHYFVLLYIQLMLTNRFFFNLLQISSQMSKWWIVEGAVLLGVTLLSVWTTRFTNVFSVYGGGGKLLGGTYLILYYVGMLIMHHSIKHHNVTIDAMAHHNNNNASIISKLVCARGWWGGAIALTSLCLYIIWWQVICRVGQNAIDAIVPFGKGFNPPSLSFIVLALTMLMFAYTFTSFFETRVITKKFVIFVSWLGRHTMPIFLYHSFFLGFILKKHFHWMPTWNIWIARLFYFSVMIFCSIILDRLFSGIIRHIQQILRNGVGNEMCN